MVVSFVPGRIRLRFRELKNQAICDLVHARLKEIAGITHVEIKTLTGSILLEYDTRILSTEKLFKLGRAELAKVNITLDIQDMAGS
jgi:copper chaperone CopZ